MNFSRTEEQQLLADALARFVQKEYAFEKRRAIEKSAAGFSREVWAKLAEMGVLGLTVPEAHGGFGGTPVDTMVVMQALGGGLVVEPYLATAVLGTSAIARTGSDAQKEEFLPSVVAGETILAFAHDEAGARGVLAQVGTRSRRDGSGFVLSGHKSVVLHGAQADHLIVSARTAGADSDERGISLFMLAPKTPGVTLRDYRTIDGMRAAELTLAEVRIGGDALLGEADAAFPAIEQVMDLGAAALCAEAVGVMEALNAQTLEYIKTRQQFGQPIGRFQALQHRAVDMMIHSEQSKSIAMLAAMKAASDDARERRRAVSAAKVHIGRSGRAVSQAAVQLHGGMGLSIELAAAHYAKRLTMIDFWLGDAETHLDRFIANG